MYQHGCVAQSMLPLRGEQQATDFPAKAYKAKGLLLGNGKVF